MGDPGESGFASQEMLTQAVLLSGLDKAKCTCGALDPSVPITIHYPACPRDEAFRRALGILRQFRHIGDEENVLER